MIELFKDMLQEMRLIKIDLEKLAKAVKSAEGKPEPTTKVTATNVISDDYYSYMSNINNMMTELMTLDPDAFPNKREIYNLIYDHMRRVYGICWEQELKDYKAKYHMTTEERPKWITACYDNETLRSIFMNRLESLLINKKEEKSMQYAPVDEPFTLVDMIPAESKRTLREMRSQKTVSEMIEPLAIKREDKSLHNNATIRFIYKQMADKGVDWKQEEEKYSKATRKTDIIMNTPELYAVFCDCVSEALA